MRASRLGRSEVEVTQLGFGGGPLGGLFAPLDDDTAAAALTAAWDCGIRYFDTSPHYGIGVSERRIGELLRHKPRAEFTLGIVVGMRSAAEARRNAEAFAAPIPAQVWADLRGAGLLDERAPVD
jgi:D-threo-aldose 1-dehydrogenase